MGRQSRAKRDRRNTGGFRSSDARRQKSYGLWLQQRGSRLGPTLAAYAEAADVDGASWIRQRLLATHNIRMSTCGRLPPDYLALCWKPLGNLTFLYAGLRQAGAEVGAHPAAYADGWPEHLRWGLDSVQQAVRLLLVGQLVGAAVLARGQLERWTENRAHNVGASKLSGESAEDFAERVWGLNPLAFVGRQMAVEDTAFLEGRHLAPGQIMQGLHRVIHAELHIDAMDWSNEGFSGDLPDGALAAASLVSNALILVTKQLRTCVSTLLQEQGNSSAVAMSRAQPYIPPVAMSPIPASLWPVNFLLVQESGITVQVERSAANYEAIFNGERPAGRLYNDAEMMMLCFTHYRARCIEAASAAFDAEAEYLGTTLTLEGFSGTETPPVMVSEMAAALSYWLPKGTPEQAAAAAISDALRGSYWLWLEDDNRAMATLRVVLEQVARLKVWRLKPQHGPSLESIGKPSRWSAKAGIGRLAALNRALGEFSHFRPQIHWGDAFNLLVDLNHGVSPDEAPKTARRSAFEVVTRLAAREICEQVRCLDSSVADAFATISLEVFAAGPEVDARVDAYLNNANSFRSQEFPRTRE